MNAHVKPEIINIAIVDIAKALHARKLIPLPTVLAMLRDFDRAHPHLAFADFVVAIELAYLADRAEGSA
jgi:hypothetical protein